MKDNQLEELDNTDNVFQFTWPDKELNANLAYVRTTKTLRPNIQESVDFDTTQNLYIEGDNLDALKLLQNNYASKIKMIYIDPPYNTGKDSFIYNDRFAQSKEDYYDDAEVYDEDGYYIQSNPESSGRFHTNWLNMMYPRLLLARDLLSDDGVIMIHIDEHEHGNLRKICDEIFGQEGFLYFVWNKKNQPSGSTTENRKIDVKTEFVFLYQRDQNQNPFHKKCYDKNELVEQGYVLQDEYFNERGYYKLTPLDRNCTASSFKYQASLDYEIEAPDGTLFKNQKNIVKPRTTCYTWSRKLYDFGLANGFIEFKKHKDGYWQVFRKNYEKVGIDNKALKVVRRDAGVAHDNLLWNMTSSVGPIDLKNLGMTHIFPTPKPVKLLSHLVRICCNANDIILDFFSGSATTAHAVMQLNAEDGGQRKFIMVQLPELCAENTEAYKQGYKNICEIGKERIRRAGKKIREETGNDKVDIGFRVLKVI